ncbi:MAG: hypothetical protein DI570_02215 [Phenylobacterium zucineum]|nr:MAG: hypothetical protein DI570_02215 [Phenylobacterium zucineum]
MRGERRRQAAWTTAGAASLAAHAVLLGLAGWLLGRDAAPREAPILNVQLVSLSAKRPPETPLGERDARPAAAPERPAPRVAATSAPDIAPLPLAPTPADPAAGVARALRGRLGCRPGDLSHRTPEERQRCAAVLAEAGAARDGDGPKLDLSRQGRISKDPRFDLSTPPKNGCKFRAAGDKGPLGQDGARAGFACAWNF